jgi:hypothetical protein
MDYCHACGGDGWLPSRKEGQSGCPYCKGKGKVTNLPTRKVATPERWQEALHRAFEQGVKVSQINHSGQWIATSGTRNGESYEITVFRREEDFAILGCSCLAGEHDDPVCKHRARWLFEHDMLEFDWNYAKGKNRAHLLNS